MFEVPTRVNEQFPGKGAVRSATCAVSENGCPARAFVMALQASVGVTLRPLPEVFVNVRVYSTVSGPGSPPGECLSDQGKETSCSAPSCVVALPPSNFISIANTLRIGSGGSWASTPPISASTKVTSPLLPVTWSPVSMSSALPCSLVPILHTSVLPPSVISETGERGTAVSAACVRHAFGTSWKTPPCAVKVTVTLSTGSFDGAGPSSLILNRQTEDTLSPFCNGL